MKSRPILYSGPMVRAILRDPNPKTQTRRVIADAPGAATRLRLNDRRYLESFIGDVLELPESDADSWVPLVGRHGCETPVRCPYGERGDRLWGRETLRVLNEEWDWGYAADDAPIQIPEGDERVPAMLSWAHHNERDVCVSIHMPRWASRITQEITNVRVQRVQEITAEDAKAEGLTCLTKDNHRTYKFGIPDRDGWPGTDNDGWPWTEWEVSPVDAYRRLWDSINAKPRPVYEDRKIVSYASFPWEDVQEVRTHRGKPWHVVGNPWVWALTFRRVEA